MKFLKLSLSGILDAFFWVIQKIPLFVIFLSVNGFLFNAFFNLKTVIEVWISMLGIVGLFCSLSFSASTSEKNLDRSEAYHFIGEKLFEITVSLGIITILKYYYLKGKLNTMFNVYPMPEFILSAANGFCFFLLIIIIYSFTKAIKIYFNLLDKKKNLFE